MTCILAIDPGLTGALAVLMTGIPDRVAVYDMPVVDGEINHHQLSHIIRSFGPDVAYIERVGPMPRDGVKQAWRFGSAYTSARVVVSLLNIPTMLVTPGAWKRTMKVGGGPEGKEQCRALALRLFPACAASFVRKKDQGRAEAALLALYAAQFARKEAA
jgi:Holliday junction resolvasome RuvABC endonuclease subunit